MSEKEKANIIAATLAKACVNEFQFQRIIGYIEGLSSSRDCDEATIIDADPQPVMG